jgi:predicted O-methyltransferase YrrM
MKNRPKSFGLTQRIHSFIRFWLHAKPWYTVHSPYIFGLVKHIKKSKFDWQKYRPIEVLRKTLKDNTTLVSYPDYGDGGRLKVRSVSSIVKLSAKHRSQCKVLSQIADYVQPEVGIELGTSLGISYAYLVKTVPNATIVTIEGGPEIAELASTNLSKLGLFGNIKLGEFDAVLPQVLKDLETVDFVYVDGHHQYEDTLRYFNLVLANLSAHGCIVFDDIYWSEGMMQAWAKIHQDERVTLSVDFYHFGLVFIRPGVVKQHFKLRL